MIKVNLLRDQTSRVRKSMPTQIISRMGLIAAAIFVLLAGGMGGWWYYLDLQVETLTQERDQLRIEDARLQSLKKQIVEYDRLKRLREGRIQIIEKLKAFQTGPVELLNHVIQCVPRDGTLWLSVLDQKGDRIQIKGSTLRGEAIPDFMTSLSATGFFKSVDLESIVSDQTASNFSLTCMTTKQLPPE
jgi:Tfp pilus assembly protein PilN